MLFCNAFNNVPRDKVRWSADLYTSVDFGLKNELCSRDFVGFYERIAQFVQKWKKNFSASVNLWTFLLIFTQYSVSCLLHFLSARRKNKNKLYVSKTCVMWKKNFSEKWLIWKDFLRQKLPIDKTIIKILCERKSNSSIQL